MTDIENFHTLMDNAVQINKVTLQLTIMDKCIF